MPTDTNVCSKLVPMNNKLYTRHKLSISHYVRGIWFLTRTNPRRLRGRALGDARAALHKLGEHQESVNPMYTHSTWCELK